MGSLAEVFSAKIPTREEKRREQKRDIPSEKRDIAMTFSFAPVSLSSLPVGFASLCWSQQLWGIASEEGALYPDPGAGPSQSLKNTAVQRGEERVRVQKKGGRVKKGGTRCGVEGMKMKWPGRGRTGERENSQVPGFINQQQHKRSTHKPA